MKGIMKMGQNESRQAESPEDIKITITNQTTCSDIMIIGRQIEKVDDILEINIFLGERHTPMARAATNVN